MKRITTASGTQYLYDEEVERIKRLSGQPIHLVEGVGPSDDVWDYLLYLSPVEVGSGLRMTLINGDWRRSTPVVEIEEVEDE